MNARGTKLFVTADPSGNLGWVSRFRIRDFQHRITVDAADNVVVTGVNFEASVNALAVTINPSPAALTKLDPNGRGLWCTHTNGVWPYPVVPYSLAVGPGGDLYAAWSTNHEWSFQEPYYAEFVTTRLSAEASDFWFSPQTPTCNIQSSSFRGLYG